MNSSLGTNLSKFGDISIVHSSSVISSKGIRSLGKGSGKGRGRGNWRRILPLIGSISVNGESDISQTSQQSDASRSNELNHVSDVSKDGQLVDETPFAVKLEATASKITSPEPLKSTCIASSKIDVSSLADGGTSVESESWISSEVCKSYKKRGKLTNVIPSQTFETANDIYGQECEQVNYTRSAVTVPTVETSSNVKHVSLPESMSNHAPIQHAIAPLITSLHAQSLPMLSSSPAAVGLKAERRTSSLRKLSLHGSADIRGDGNASHKQELVHIPNNRTQGAGERIKDYDVKDTSTGQVQNKQKTAKELNDNKHSSLAKRKRSASSISALNNVNDCDDKLVSVAEIIPESQPLSPQISLTLSPQDCLSPSIQLAQSDCTFVGQGLSGSLHVSQSERCEENKFNSPKSEKNQYGTGSDQLIFIPDGVGKDHEKIVLNADRPSASKRKGRKPKFASATQTDIVNDESEKPIFCRANQDQKHRKNQHKWREPDDLNDLSKFAFDYSQNDDALCSTGSSPESPSPNSYFKSYATSSSNWSSAPLALASSSKFCREARSENVPPTDTSVRSNATINNRKASQHVSGAARIVKSSISSSVASKHGKNTINGIANTRGTDLSQMDLDTLVYEEGDADDEDDDDDEVKEFARISAILKEKQMMLQRKKEKKMTLAINEKLRKIMFVTHAFESGLLQLKPFDPTSQLDRMKTAYAELGQWKAKFQDMMQSYVAEVDTLQNELKEAIVDTMACNKQHIEARTELSIQRKSNLTALDQHLNSHVKSIVKAVSCRGHVRA
jgi:hypothetical protein